jgi:hypothetical protein
MLRASTDLEGDIVTSKRSQSMRLGLRFKPELLREAYDAVVIGSGPGGLSAAVCLSKRGPQGGRFRAALNRMLARRGGCSSTHRFE